MNKNNVPEYALARKIEKLDELDNKITSILSISSSIRGRTFLRLPVRTQKKLLENLSKNDVLVLLQNIDPDEATDVLQRISSEDFRADILENLQEQLREKVEFLLRFNPESAAGLMSLDYTIVSFNQTLSSVNKLVIKHEAKTGKFPTILVERDGECIGELQSYFLAIRNPRERVLKHTTPINTIKYDESQDKIIKKFRDTRHDKVLVVDDLSSIIGIIYSDDIIGVLDNKTKSLYDDFFHLGGVNRDHLSEGNSILDVSILTGVKNRLSWLIAGLVGALLIATFITFFKETLATYILIASFIPAVIYISGALGTQIQTVLVRDLAVLGESFKAKSYFLKQLSISLIIALIMSLTLFGFISLFWSELLIAFTIALACFISLIFTSFVAFFITLTIKKFNFDPAFGSGPMVNIFSDSVSVIVYFSVVMLLL